ncbi:uncharacterized protein CLUP02_07245 [Colletotrichum lupini]|uniref:Uncharacterized protein n=1 Tax=Colletotrichum lupini TaxID=145971 RepID=A0A9Q8WFS9_9PEZI|nr:uncharacterized protein CLUP02_07245 [Colletotrichum lupini]UQC81759.1 hypothetical protein CLUP02_07245 [Colletotrichum lupini]
MQSAEKSEISKKNLCRVHSEKNVFRPSKFPCRPSSIQTSRTFWSPSRATPGMPVCHDALRTTLPQSGHQGLEPNFEYLRDLYENRHSGAEDDMSVLDSGYMYVSIGPPSQQTKRMPVKPDTEVAGHAEGIGDAFAGDVSGRLAPHYPVKPNAYMYILMAMLCYALHCESDRREEEKQIRSTYYYASSRMAWLDAFALWQRVAHHHRPMESDLRCRLTGIEELAHSVECGNRPGRCQGCVDVPTAHASEAA